MHPDTQNDLVTNDITCKMKPVTLFCFSCIFKFSKSSSLQDAIIEVCWVSLAVLLTIYTSSDGLYLCIFCLQYIFRAAGTELDSPRREQLWTRLQAIHMFLDSYETLIANVHQRRKLTILEEETKRGRKGVGWCGGGLKRDRGSIMRGETAGVLMMKAWRRYFVVVKSPHSCWYSFSVFYYSSLHLSVDNMIIREYV